MSDIKVSAHESVEAAYERGRRAGLATAALGLAVIAYVNLLGFEKSLLALALVAMVLKGATLSSKTRTRSWIALVLASVHAVTVVAIVIVYADKLALLARQVIELYHSLS